MDVIWPELENPAWIAARWSAGKSDEQIAAELGCPVPSVRIALIRFGHLGAGRPWRRRHGPRPSEPEVLDLRLHDAEWLRRRYLVDGWTVERIADECGVRPIDVRRTLLTAGVTERRPRRA